MSTKKLCTFMLNISNVIRKGGVTDFDFLHVMVALTSWGFQFILDNVASIDDGIWDALAILKGLDIGFLVWVLEVVGVLQFHPFIAFSSKYICYVNFNKSKYVILALDFLRSSKIL